MFYLFTCIIPNYVWKNSHFELIWINENIDNTLSDSFRMTNLTPFILEVDFEEY